MRVVFDAFWWVHGPASVRRVLRETVTTWHRLYPDDELTVVARRRHAARVDVPDGVAVEVSRLYPQALVARYAVARTARLRSADAVVSHNFAARTAAVSTIYLHDVLFVSEPSWFTRAERAYFSFMLRWIRSADLVFTSSESEGDRISRLTAASLVRPVGLGMSRELLEVAPSPDADLLPQQFLLSVGRLNARKNLGRAIAGALASGRVSVDFPLVIVGAADGLGEDLSAEIETARRDGLVRFTGHIDDGRLRWLFENCAVFVYVSLGEGYGMPPVEALAFGAIPVVSDLPVFHEILGGRAQYVDPLSVGSIAEGIDIALGRPGETPVVVGREWEQVVSAMRSEIGNRIGGAA